MITAAERAVLRARHQCSTDLSPRPYCTNTDDIRGDHREWADYPCAVILLLDALDAIAAPDYQDLLALARNVAACTPGDNDDPASEDQEALADLGRQAQALLTARPGAIPLQPTAADLHRLADGEALIQVTSPSGGRTWVGRLQRYLSDPTLVVVTGRGTHYLPADYAVTVLGDDGAAYVTRERLIAALNHMTVRTPASQEAVAGALLAALQEM